MPLTKSTPIETYISDFVKSDNPKFEGKSKEKRRKMAIAAYYSKQNESIDEMDLDQLDQLTENRSEHVSNILAGIHKAKPEERAKHLKYLKTVLHPDDYKHIKNSLDSFRNESVEDDTLLEALRSKKAYGEMQSYISHAPDNHFHSSVPALLHHGLSSEDRHQNDYARHAALFDKRLSDKHLDTVSQHIASAGKTTDELDKNFHKNVHSVNVLRAAMKNDSPDVIKDAKKGITADHKNAIFSHGSEEEKAFVLHHGLANKSQLKHSLEHGSDTVKAVAKSHLRSLQAAGNSKHEDLYHHIAKPDAPADKESFFSKLKTTFKANLAKRKSAAEQKGKPKERIEPTFEHLVESLFINIAEKRLHEATQNLEDIFTLKLDARLDEIRGEIVQAKYNKLTD